MSYIGTDLGTSGVKVLLIRDDGTVKSASRSYPVSYPKPDHSEQSPEDWYNGMLEALSELLQNENAREVKAISFSGQMHGLVMLDGNDNVIRPAILWNDGRSVKQVEYLNNVIGKDFLLENTGNIAFAGFTAPKLLWVKENEPENFTKTAKIMLPKDYLAYRLSGVFATDVSDASGTLYFDVGKRRWSEKMLELIGITEKQLPEVKESREIIGTVKPEICERFGFNKDIKVVIGAGDNAASAIGTGTVNDGDCNISLGTSGTIFVETEKHAYDSESAIHAFCSAAGKYHYLACILSAASCQKWWIEDILKTDYSTEGMEKYLGNNDVIFLPYLTGERSPINDPSAKALLYGMTPYTTREQMSLAVLEGVALALKQNIELIRALGVKITRSKICGGGAKNKLWIKIIASALNVTLEIPLSEQGGALGAALLAAKATVTDEEYRMLTEKFYGVKEYIYPDEKLVGYYNDKFEIYKKLYI